MKKNLMSVIILALVFANFVLTAVLMFTTLPQTQKANAMIEAVCKAIDLELNSGAATGLSNLPIDQIENYPVNSGEKMTVNLSDGSYALVSVAISVNKESERYKDNEGVKSLEAQEAVIKNTINQSIRQYSKEDFLKNTKEVQKEILKELQKMYESDFVVGVTFPDFTVQ